MTRYWIPSIALIFSLVIMMSSTAFAGAFLTDGGTAVSSVDADGDTFNVINRARTDTTTYSIIDTWNSDNNGYTGDDYQATSTEVDGNPVNFDEPVYYIGTFSGNDRNENVLEDLIQYFLGTDYSISAYAKVDGTTGSSSSDDAVGGLSFELYDTADDTKSGKWKITEAESRDYAPNEKINFYSVKGGTEFALYYVNPQQSAGTWTTAHVENNGGNQPDISHFSVVRTSGLETSETPEPATLLLFGFSLIWLAGMVRKKSRH